MILLDPAHQITATDQTGITYFVEKRSIGRGSITVQYPRRSIRVTVVKRIVFDTALSSAESYEAYQMTYDTAIFRKSIKQGEFGLYPFDQPTHEDRTLINKPGPSI